ncbi:MAG: SDR family NAD(P)-dependent oxidoreductase [Magnetococcales bacterium]|nr:SDR family NAD(P)-dependent oxidoreductase [Magnetococcales bacterium]
MSLENRVILITGAGSGLGRALAVAFARQGAHLFLLGRDQKRLEATDDLIRQAGGKAGLIPLDLETGLQRVPEVAKALFERFGRLDLLVNNAAITGPRTPMDAHCPAEWQAVFRVNLDAPFFLTRELLPLLRFSNAGVVIQVVCEEGVAVAPFRGAYGASKAALLHMTRTWAAEIASGPVRMHAVDPGPMATPLRARVFPGEDASRLPRPESVVSLFARLADPAFRGEHGQLLTPESFARKYSTDDS